MVIFKVWADKLNKYAHMKIIKLFVLLMWLSKLGIAQNLDDLKAYLDSNNISIDLKDSNTANPFFKSIMKDRALFVFGEGGSHDLELNNHLRVYLINQFSKLNLKDFLFEGGRSNAFIENNYIQSSQDNADSLFRKNLSYRIQMQQIRQLYQKGFHFAYKGIDMEWGRGFFSAVKLLTSYLNQTVIQASPFLRSVLIDTSYLHYDKEDVYNNQKQFLNYYKSLQKIFKADTVSLQNILSSDSYDKIKYFLSNPQTASPYANRNPGMAENLLNEIMPIDTASTYLLDIGNAHLGIVQKKELLKSKSVVMTVYCDKCTINNKEIIDDKKYMRNGVLDVFRKVSKGDLTIFDVSKLPKEFTFLRAYWDLILFAKEQK